MDTSTSTLKLPVLAFGGGIAAGLIMSSVAKKLKTSQDEFSIDKIPEKWVRVGEISDLTIYPVKSMPGIKVENAICTTLGLQDASNPNLRDRTFLVTDSKGNFRTQRQIPQMALIYPSMKEDTMHFKYVGNGAPEVKEISFKIPKDEGTNKSTVRIWNDKLQALDCGEKVGKWLDTVTGSEGLKLFFHHETESFRTVAADQKAFPTFRQKDTGTFHDETSYMLMTEASLLELNSKMSRQMSERSFRPSMMLKNVAEPWSEDFWSFIRIGSGRDSTNSPVFKTSRPCVRCKMTTIDPDTGNIIDDGEPLKTLTSLKRTMRDPTVTKIVKNSAVMGAHFGMLKNDGAVINVGDAVYTAVL